MQQKEFSFKSQPPVYFGLSRANNHLPDGEEKVCPSLGMLLGPVSCVVRLGSEEEGRPSAEDAPSPPCISRQSPRLGPAFTM